MHLLKVHFFSALALELADVVIGTTCDRPGDISLENTKHTTTKNTTASYCICDTVISPDTEEVLVRTRLTATISVKNNSKCAYPVFLSADTEEASVESTHKGVN